MGWVRVDQAYILAQREKLQAVKNHEAEFAKTAKDESFSAKVTKGSFEILVESDGQSGKQITTSGFGVRVVFKGFTKFSSPLENRNKIVDRFVYRASSVYFTNHIQKP